MEDMAFFLFEHVPTLIGNESLTNLTKSGIKCSRLTYKQTPLHNKIILILPIIVLCLGTIGNVPTYFIFRKKAYKKNIMSSMFRYQSVLDMVFIYFTLSRFIVEAIWRFKILQRDITVCYINAFVTLTLMSISNWLLVLITLTRLIHLKYPLKTRTICSKFNYYASFTFTIVFVVAFHGGTILSNYLMSITFDNTKSKGCYFQIYRKEVQSRAKQIAYSIVNFVGPLVMIIILNVLLIRELRKLKSKQKKLFGNSFIDATTAAASSGLHTDGTSADEDTSHNALVQKGTDSYQRFELQHKDKIISTRSITINEGRKGQKSKLSPCSRFNCELTNQTMPPAVLDDIKMFNLETDSFYQKKMGNFYMIDNQNNSADTINATGPAKNPAKSRFKGHQGIINFHDTVYGDESEAASVTRSDGRKFSLRSWISDTMSHGVDIEFPEEAEIKDHPGIKPTKSSSPNRLQRAYHSENSKTKSLTNLLIIASAVFLCTNLPFWVFQLYIYREFGHLIDCSTQFMILDILFIVRYSNNSLNFIFYFVMGSRYRDDFLAFYKKLCCRKCSK